VKNTIEFQPTFALLRVSLEPGETITAEAGAMVTREGHVAMRTRMNSDRRAGFFGKVWMFFICLVRKLVGGETFFVNDFSATRTGEVTLAPTMSGNILHKRLDGQSLLLQSGAYLASSGDVRMKLRWGGLRTLFAREGLFLLELSGTGDLWFTSYGGVVPVPVDGAFVVDTGHMVAFDATLDFKVTTPGGGVMGFIASGEGLVCEFSGKGTVYMQSRNVSALTGWIAPYLGG
jgi:uncharacterized protein (TIGR00266 family)